MKLTEIFAQLSIGEFKQLAIGGASEGGIFEKNQYEAINHITLGLTDLHKRFNLKTRKLLLTVVPGTLEYALAPAAGDLLKVIQAWDQDGAEISLNDASDDLGVMTPSYNELSVPSAIAARGGQLVVKYRADHPPIAANSNGLPLTALGQVEVNLPRTHLRALLLFVAWRAYTPTGITDPNATSVNYMQQYEMECAMLDAAGMQVDSQAQTGHEKFHRGGWV